MKMLGDHTRVSSTSLILIDRIGAHLSFDFADKYKIMLNYHSLEL